MSKLPPATLLTALRGYFTSSNQKDVVVETDALIELLGKLPALSSATTATPHIEPILVQIQTHHPGLGLLANDHATVSFVDECITNLLKETDLDFRVEALIRGLSPYIAIEALKQDLHVLLQPLPIFTLLDRIIHTCVGWSEDLGFLGEQYFEKVEAAISPLLRGKVDFEAAIENLDNEIGAEAKRHKKLEKSLCDAELKTLAQQEARHYAAELLNQKMANQPLPLFIIFMLQGAWFEFLQKVHAEFNHDARESKQADELTELLVWSLQPQPDEAKQKQLSAELPRRILGFAKSMPFDTEEVEQCMADVIAEYEAIAANEASPPCDFDLLQTDPYIDTGRSIKPELQQRIGDLVTGSWFLYDDKQDSEEKIARIRLLINWQATNRLLFTNQNRRKVMHMSYPDFAARLTSGTIKPLNQVKKVSDQFQQQLDNIIKTIKAQKARELKEREAKRRKEISLLFRKERKHEIKDELSLLKKQAIAKQRRAKLLRNKAARKLELATNAVKALKPDAWVKLPIMEGTQTPCKLVAVMASTDNYIFANRAGIKVAEYSTGQLAHLIVTENSEILDTGAEFESALATVVTGLRQNKEKSYDELTGSA